MTRFPPFFVPGRIPLFGAGRLRALSASRILCLAVTLGIGTTLWCPLLRCAAHDAPQPASVILISIDTLRADHLSCLRLHQNPHAAHRFICARGHALCPGGGAGSPHAAFAHVAVHFHLSVPEWRGGKRRARSRRSGDARFRVAIARLQNRRVHWQRLPRPPLWIWTRASTITIAPSAQETTRVDNPLAMSLRRDGALVVRAARQWLDSHRGQPVFVFVHLFDLHTPYTLPPEVARQKRNFPLRCPT